MVRTLYDLLVSSPGPQPYEGDLATPRTAPVRVCVDLEDIVAGGGEWRTRLARRLTAVAADDVVAFRELDGEALLTDGRVMKWLVNQRRNVDNPRLRDSYRVFEFLHRELVSIGKPWMPELSPCHTQPLRRILEDLDFELIDGATNEEIIEIPRGVLTTGRWVRHLSRAEIAWLSRKLDTAFRDITFPLRLAVRVTAVRGRLRNGLLSGESALHALTTSVLASSTVHIDQWPMQLPGLDVENAQEDRDVSLLFRAITSRIGQNGRLSPVHHRNLVMNLWEPPENARPASDNEGQFARATEFVFKANGTGNPADATRESVLREALRTVVYLALVRRNENRTIHNIAQTLFKTRRPLLHVGPARAEDGWAVEAVRAWAADGADNGFVPMGLRIRYPHVATYDRVLDLVRPHLDPELLARFRDTLWCASTDGFFGFPWDSRPGSCDSPSAPAHFGAAADQLVLRLAECVDENMWIALGEAPGDRAAFQAVLQSLLVEADKERFLTDANAHWMYRSLLATSIFFDERGFEHRQVPLPIGEHSGEFLPAGIYMLTQRVERQRPPLRPDPAASIEMFSDAMARFCSLQVAGQAARALLSMAAMRITRREVKHQVKLRLFEQQVKYEQDLRDRARGAISDLSRTFERTRRDFQRLIGLPAVVSALWEKVGQDEDEFPPCLYSLTHGSNWEEQVRARESTFAVIDRALADAGPAVVSALKRRIDKLLASADSWEARRDRFKDCLRSWRQEQSVVAEVVAALKAATNSALSVLPPWQATKGLEYPTIPEAWLPALKDLATAPRGLAAGVRERFLLGSFIYEETGWVRAGFVTLSVETVPPQAGTEETVKRAVEPLIAKWAEVSVVAIRNGDMTCSGPSLPDDMLRKIELNLAVNGVAVVMTGFTLQRLRA